MSWVEIGRYMVGLNRINAKDENVIRIILVGKIIIRKGVAKVCCIMIKKGGGNT